MTKRKNPATSRTSKRGLWGARFDGGPSAAMRAIGDSLHVDQRLVDQDLRGSIAHARMLGDQGILRKADARKIVSELGKMRREIARGELVVEGADEDVHSWIERVLTERIGDDGARLHTARSRNDQVATAFRLFLRDGTAEVNDALRALQSSLVARAAEMIGVIVPAYTHLQRGQPVLLSHQFLAYVEMLERDRGRFLDQARRMNECPLGAGAATGVPYPIDRAATAKELLFDRPTANSMDSVADRDFAAEWLAAAAILAVHLSRLAEDICLWASSEFGLLSLGDAVSTGSSIMPQKRNPDGAELVRGKAGRVIGSLVSLLTTLKALPLTYNRDLQEDKEVVFDALDTSLVCLRMLDDTLAESRFVPEAAARLLEGGHLLATELADFLVGKGVPFRLAHEAVGEVVKECDDRGVDLSELSEEDLVALHPRFADCAETLDFASAVDRRDHLGGTATKRVRAAIRKWVRRLAPRR